MPVSRAFALFALLATLSPASAQEAVWEPTSGPRSGYTNALTAGDDGRLFVVAAGDLYRSDDGGNRWAPVPTPLGEVVDFALSTDGAFFVWSVIFCTVTCGQEGAYTSNDEGETWTRIEILGSFPLVYSVEVAAAGRAFAGTDLGLFYSDDGGASWTPTPLGVSNAYGLAAHRAGYVGALGYGVGAAALSYSSDNGETWTTTPLPPELPPLRDLRLDAQGNVAAANPHQQAEALYRSTDGGVRWKPIPFPAPCSTAEPCRVDAFDLVDVDGNGDSGLFASFSRPGTSRSLGVFRTGDYVSWVATGLEGPAASAFAVGGGSVLASTSRAVFRYAGGGAESRWTPSSEGITRSWTEVLASGADGALYAGAFEGDVSRYDIATNAWTPLPYLRFPAALVPAADGRLFAGTSGEPGAWVLDAAEEVWTPLGLRNVRSLHRTAAGTLLAGAWHVGSSLTLARSTDDGASWSATASFNPLTFLDADGEAGGTLYVGTGTGVHRSADDGLTWEPLGPEDTAFTGLSTQGGVLWAVTPYDKDGRIGGRVFRSDDGGATWALAWAAPLYHRLESVVATAGAVYVSAGRDGLYRSTDDGAAWEPYAEGFPERASVDALTLGPDGRLYAGLWMRSVYRTAQPVTTASEPGPTTGHVALHFPYPNPTARRAVVPFEVGTPSLVRLCVYDVLGREVVVLHDGPLAAGEHRFSFDGIGLPAGVYVVRATGGGLDLARRVTLLR